MSMLEKIKRRWRYRKTWGTPVGQDCISLGTSLCRWLGERLIFLGTHAISYDPVMTHEEWKAVLTKHGGALLGWASHYDHPMEEEAERLANATAAMHWVAANLGTLWD